MPSRTVRDDDPGRRCSPRAAIALLVVARGGGRARLAAGRAGAAAAAPDHRDRPADRRAGRRARPARADRAAPARATRCSELADTFDAMLERLDRSFDGQRRFVANASHELRTPLAINRTLLEVAVTRPDASPRPAPARRRRCWTVNERHERLIDGLLTLADSENEITERTPVDLADVAEPRDSTRSRRRGAAGRWHASSSRRRRPATRSCWSGWCRTWWRTRVRHNVAAAAGCACRTAHGARPGRRSR